MIKINKRLAWELAGLALVIAAATWLLYALGLIDFFMNRQRVAALIQEHRAYAGLIFIGLQIVQVVAAPIPGEATGLVGGFLFGKLWGILFSTIGLTIGSWLAFGLARLIGRPLVELVVSDETIKRYDYVMKHKGLFLAFLMFLIPGFPKDILCYILGLGHMRQRDFLFVSTAGRLFGTTLLTIGGSFYRDERYGAFFTVAALSIVAILLVMIYRESIEKWFKKIRLAERVRARRERRKSAAKPGKALQKGRRGKEGA